MTARRMNRSSSEEGFTLIELLVVIIILAILLAIAVPSYLSFRDRANKTAAAANVRSLIPSVESYQADNTPGGVGDPDAATSTSDSGYAGMTILLLRSTYDQAIPASDFVNNSGVPEAAGVTTSAPLNATHYCVYSQVGNWFAYKLNPAGPISSTTDPAQVCT
jgi:type IV pilus assembly protein PilA